MIKLLLLPVIISTFISCTESEIGEPEREESPVSGTCDYLYPPLDTVIVSHTAWTKNNYPSRIKKFMEDSIDTGDIVMLGNSLTEQGGNWEVRLGRQNVKNRGISGDNTDGVLARLNEIICNVPSMVILMIGTNDLFTSSSPEKIAKNIDRIGSSLIEALPQTRVIVQTIMPLTKGHQEKLKLMTINDLLRANASREYQLLDTFKEMANASDDLPEEFTNDGIHLTATGYRKWSQLLIDTIEK